MCILHKHTLQLIHRPGPFPLPAAATLGPGAEIYWSIRRESESDRAKCIVSGARSEAPGPPQPKSSNRAAAHNAFAAAAAGAQCACPRVQLCVRTSPGQIVPSLAVKGLPAAAAGTPDDDREDHVMDELACSTIDAQSCRSIARMLRLLCTPVKTRARASWLRTKNGKVSHGDADECGEVRAGVGGPSRVSVGGRPTQMNKTRPFLSGRFGALTSLALVARPSSKKARRVGGV